MARMAVFGFWALILLAGTDCLYVFQSFLFSWTTGNDVEDRSRYSPFALEGRYRQGISMEEIQTDNVDLRTLETNCSSFEIYCHYVSRPIEHDTPIIPYIPGLTPPHPQKHGRFDSSPPA